MKLHGDKIEWRRWQLPCGRRFHGSSPEAAMDAAELDENWKRACRGNNLINRFPEPQDANGLVGAVLNQIDGTSTTPDTILRGLAMGFSSSDYEVSGEARY